MKVAILQSNYIPWKGYFDIVSNVDIFIFHDDIQYTKDDWRNRNKIRTIKGSEWLTIPCGRNEKRLICEVSLADHSWQKKHWKKLNENYGGAPYYNLYRDFFAYFYLQHNWSNLSELNQLMIKKVSTELLGIETKFHDSREYKLTLSKGKRIKELLYKVGASHYLSGPSAKNYLDVAGLKNSGIDVEWMSYDGYPAYPQQFSGFDHYVSIIDLLFNVGPEFEKYMRMNQSNQGP